MHRMARDELGDGGKLEDQRSAGRKLSGDSASRQHGEARIGVEDLTSLYDSRSGCVSTIGIYRQSYDCRDVKGSGSNGYFPYGFSRSLQQEFLLEKIPASGSGHTELRKNDYVRTGLSGFTDEAYDLTC